MTYEELKKAFEGTQVVIGDELISLLRTYAALLAEWNEKMNLTAITEEPIVIEKHFMDSLLIAKDFVFAGKKIADIGSGAGFPGVVLALAFPSCHVTLIDATKKKFLFLQELKEKLGIGNIAFHVGRVEDMKAERDTFDIVTARGFAAMNIFLEVA
ncbi:16S rRNA (guanine(527)-N(7))-methyltransferase RsmG, partial [bacterium]|nr:16S rRNA (guanine(527)-N(7))-methyltransferase RsmG [bacterium]